MKTYFKKYLTVLAFTPLLFTACSESFLEEINPNEETTVTYWVNEANVKKG